MKLNKLEVMGNLAQDAEVRDAGNNRQVLLLRVITSRRWNGPNGEEERTVGHNVVRFGKTGQFDKLVTHLKKGQGVFVEGTYEKDYSEKDGVKYLNDRINASFGGALELVNNAPSHNRIRIGGYLADDAVIRDTGKGECISFTVMTTESWGPAANQSKTVAHDVIQFGEKGQFTSLCALLKKGAGVMLAGEIEKENREVEGRKFLNITVNATFETIKITKYVTEKEDQNSPQQSAVTDPQAAPSEPQSAPGFPEDDSDDIPF